MMPISIMAGDSKKTLTKYSKFNDKFKDNENMKLPISWCQNNKIKVYSLKIALILHTFKNDTYLTLPKMGKQ